MSKTQRHERFDDENVTLYRCPRCQTDMIEVAIAGHVMVCGVPSDLPYYNVRTAKLKPTGDHARDTLVAARINARRDA